MAWMNGTDGRYGCTYGRSKHTILTHHNDISTWCISMVHVVVWCIIMLYRVQYIASVSHVWFDTYMLFSMFYVLHMHIWKGYIYRTV